MSSRRRGRIGAAVGLASLFVAGSFVSTAFGNEVRGQKESRPKIGCDLLKEPSSMGNSAKKSICVKTDVEAWYHTSTSGSGLPPITGLPAFNPYEDNTLHAGIKQGSEDSRIYLTFDLSDLSVDAFVESGTLVFAVEPDGSNISDDLELQACSVIEPPKKSEQGSFDTPPEVDCTSEVIAKYEEKPLPHFTVDLTDFAASLTAGSGVALLPGKKAVEEQQTWDISTYAKRNEEKDAVDIGAVLIYEEFDLSLEEPFSETPSDLGVGSGGGFNPPSTSGGGGFDFGSDFGPTTDTFDSAQPVEAQPEANQELGAVSVPQYKGVWYLPIVLLALIAFLGLALNRDFKGARV